MSDFRLRTDLQRAVIDGFALPLGVEPIDLRAPVQGYTVTYTAGEDDDPDTYAFHVVVSHERIAHLVRAAFDLLPARIFPIVEIGSRDAYRSMDVFLAAEPVSRDAFLESWRRFEPLLLEDVTIAAGANSEDPFVEIFVDQWKGLSIHVPLSMRDEVENLLERFDLEEVPETWELDDDHETGPSQVRAVLDTSDEFAPDLDQVLLDLRHEWQLELNVDPDSNVDEGGRRLGLTLWQAMVIVESAHEGNAEGAYASIWATAGSLAEMEGLIEIALQKYPEWQFSEIFTIDRVAYDERPDELADLPPRRQHSEVHLIRFEPWTFESDAPPEQRPRA